MRRQLTLAGRRSRLFSGQRWIVEKLWQEFFSDPSQWWDHRSEKLSARYPDFKHKKRQDALWLSSNLNPSWVEAELAAMAPGTVQSDTFAWNQRFARYVKAGQHEKTIKLFQQIQHEGMIPDTFTFVQVLNSCACLGALEAGRNIHTKVLQSGCESTVYVANSLIDMYTKCGSIEDAQRVFNRMSTRNVVSWSAMILGHVKCGQGQKALELFQQMKLEGVEPNHVTFVAVLNACASVMALEEGRHVHEEIIQRGFESDVIVGSSLIDMYAKCDSIDDAQSVFNRMPKRNVVSWNVIILGHVKHGQGQKALELFQQMRQAGVEPNDLTFVGVLNACATLVALEEGRHVHDQIIQTGFESDVFVGNSLVNMYAKCGSIEDALKVFNRMPTRDVISWNTMLWGYAMHGYAKEAHGHFEQMCEKDIEINHITFISLLSACSHAGLVDEGLHYFDLMSSRFSISATVEHYACMVDLLGRAGHLQEAEHLIMTMSCEPNPAVWMALLGACKRHGNVEMGERVAKQAMQIGPGNAFYRRQQASDPDDSL
ncbi:unnamed protein product [Sphagnum troendelagicum]|uniref:Pentatricopeptide repeat-containing protein n=1 Tax=Sphagnum troendelagicum TaxID=128251 RepID=A0ABP0TH48_9BRYO